MAVTLIVETGESIPNANSFLSLAEAVAMAASLQIVLPADEDEIKSKLIKATNYLETVAFKFQGNIKTLNQGLSFPRTGVYVQGLPLPDNSIPRNLKMAQFSVFNAILQGFEPNQNVAVSELIIKDKTDVLETTFANPVDYGIANTILVEADAFLLPLFKAASGAALRSFRA